MAFRIQTNAAPDFFDAVISGAPTNQTLAQLDRLLNWDRLRAIFAPVYDDSGQGQLGHDPVVLYKMLLLEELYGLSDVQVSIEAGDRLSFRRFLGLSAADRAPDDTTLVKFRNRLRTQNLLGRAQQEISKQLKALGLAVQPGTIKVVDATVIEAATKPPAKKEEQEEDEEQATAKPSKRDRDAAFGGKKKKLRFGYKMHAAIDVGTGQICQVAVTPANVSDTVVFEQLLEEEERGVLADKGYDSEKNREVLRKRGALDGIMRRVGERRRNSVLGRLETLRNRELTKLRSPFEGVFACMKRRRLGRAIYVGLAKVTEQVMLAVTVHNLLKSLRWREKCAQ